MKKIKTIRILILLLLSVFSFGKINAQCILTCNDLNNFFVLPGESLTIAPSDILEGNNQGCTNLQISFNITQPTASQFSSTVNIPVDTYGSFLVSVAEIDAQGNIIAICWGNMIIAEPQDCSSDITPPVAICDINTYVSLIAGDDFEVPATLIDDGSYDGCSSDLSYFITTDLSLSTPPSTETILIPSGTNGTITAALWVVDEAGNFNFCVADIIVEPGLQDCSSDTIPPVVICDINTYVSLIAGDDFDVPATLIDDGSYDGCSSDLSYFITTDLSLSAPPSTGTLLIPSGTNGTITAALWVVDEAGNFNYCVTDIIVETKQLVVGNIFIDENQDCLYDANNESSVGGFGVQYTINQGATYIPALVNSDGSYAFAVEGQAGMEITLEVILPNGVSSNCLTSETIILPFTGTIVEDFSVELADDCDNMTVDISTGILRSCVPTSYNVNYCNLSAYDIDDAELHVTFPPDFSIFGAQIPYTDLGNNELLFDLGTVPTGTCNQFTIDVLLDCSVPLGATKCVEASISPNSCLGGLGAWTGSTLRVMGECDDTDNLVRFEIENIGTGDMQNSLNYIVIEDVVMSMTEPIQLPSGEIEIIEIPANGSTWRLEIPQESGHPYLSIPSAAIEGCVDYGSMGFITQFSTPDLEPFIAIDCQEVVASYDPNDKLAYPTGYDTEHFIEPNTSIEYKIRFQNTGNDTAFYVRLEDRISEHLDITSIEPGASSHAYRFELKEDRTINFHFENILLPDSTTNLEASQGFVQFRINQLPDNELGTVIENTADIYFDFNETVVTNTVHHTLGTNFISTRTVQTFVPNLKIGVAPNPFTNFTNITLEGIENINGEFELYDVMGRLVKIDSFSDNIYQLEREGISSGTYFFRFLNGKGLLANGKLVIE